MTETTSENDVKVLNSLLGTTIDSVDGYTAGLADLENKSWTTLLETVIHDRRGVVQQLQAAVIGLGGTPENDGTLLGDFDRAIMKFKTDSTEGDDALIRSIESSEDRLKARFEKALLESEVSAATKLTIQSAFEVVNRGVLSIVAAKDSLPATKHGIGVE